MIRTRLSAEREAGRYADLAEKYARRAHRRGWYSLPAPREDWELGPDVARQIPGQEGKPCVLDWPTWFEHYYPD